VSAEACSIGCRVALTVIGAAGAAVNEGAASQALAGRNGADAVCAGTARSTFVVASPAIVVVS